MRFSPPLSAPKLVESGSSGGGSDSGGSALADSHVDGFVAYYFAMANYVGKLPSSHFVDYLRFSHSAATAAAPTTLDLAKVRNIEHVDSFPLEPLAKALQLSKIFDGIEMVGVVRAGVLSAVAQAIALHNSTIKRLRLVGCGATATGAAHLATALSTNTTIGITSLDLSRNDLKDEAMLALVAGIRSSSARLRSLRLNKCGLTHRSVAALCYAFADDSDLAKKLRVLELSDNDIGAVGSHALASWLDTTTNTTTPLLLTHLSLEHSGVDVLKLVASLVRSSTLPSLLHLSLARSSLSSSDIDALSTLLSASEKVSINLSDNGLSTDALTTVLSGAARSSRSSNLDVDFSYNDCSGGAAQVLHAVNVARNVIRCLNLRLTKLSLSDKHELFIGLKKQKQLRQLVLSFESANPKRSVDKQLKLTMTALHELLLGGIVEKLAIYSNPPKYALTHHLYLLLSNLSNYSSLRYLDIYGNLIGDEGAVLLGEQLGESGCVLETLHIDRNDISRKGLDALLVGARQSNTLCDLVYPVKDINRARRRDRADADAMHAALVKLKRDVLRRNAVHKVERRRKAKEEAKVKAA
eukprot:CAMPEP_0198371452 /NCGR_PEP_ID=MMETSP1450-20131203/157233_1 /TAXON_ID=753684 ORGANISM="Madagascaria erythrocladiodes, Strain CCMP3234" /NCGR_SAMPLE_ID=MMETSP1450 /ASSEMBLY_ACC=CAM_ASM_001115 /LENGTH=581 /DNA_ID=CAMNT_0044079015 /DNA_START=415 /DNA_END=2156 /DNA_ORIENTATION=+